jgi:hypothetical protein
MEWKTKRDRKQTIRMRLGIIPLKEITQLAQQRWFGQVVRMGYEKYRKMAWQGRTQGKRLKRRPRQTWKEGIQMVLNERGIEWKRVRDGKLFLNTLHLPVEEVRLSEVIQTPTNSVTNGTRCKKK